MFRNRITLAPWMLVAGLVAACGGTEFEDESAAVEAELTVVLTIDGRVLAMSDPQPGAVVQAFDATGKRLGRAVAGTDGRYRLPLTARPTRLLATAIHHPPRSVANPALRVSSARATFDIDVGPWLGADFSAENKTYAVSRSTTAPALVRNVAWGLGGGVGSPQDEASDLTVGPRLARLTTLLPAGTRLVPNVEEGVVTMGSGTGRYLEARFSEQLDTYNLGAASTGLLIQQIVQTISHADGRGLPVRIRVRCTTCSAGYKNLRDGHVGPTGPSGSYRPAAATAALAFSDLRGHRYADHVTMARDLALLPAGIGTAFRPDANASRAFMAELLVKALGLTLLNPTTARFTDVPRNRPSFRAIETAAGAGVLTSATARFNPEGTLSRAELAGFLANAAKWPAWTKTTESFTDVARSYWAYGRIETAFGFCRSVEPRGDFTNTNFQPALAATRAEAVAGTMRMMNCFTGAEIGAR